MPIWFFIAGNIVGLVGVGLVTMTVSLFVAARLVRIDQIRWLTCLKAGALLSVISTILVGVWVASGGRFSVSAAVVLLLVFLQFVAIPVTMFRRVGRAGWGRTAAAGATFVIVNAVAGQCEAYGWKRLIAEGFAISTQSMAPTIERGDRVIVDKALVPRRWDLAMFYAPYAPSETSVKRVVGLPGETIEIVDGEIMVDGRLCAKPAALAWLKYDGLARARMSPSHGGTGSPMTLGPDEYFVLGDNTAASLDSRLWDTGPAGHQLGAVPRGMIVGTARMIYAPFSRVRVLR